MRTRAECATNPETNAALVAMAAPSLAQDNLALVDALEGITEGLTEREKQALAMTDGEACERCVLYPCSDTPCESGSDKVTAAVAALLAGEAGGEE
jgi:hypothetical protein